LENRETELTKLDERLSKLRAQLDRRRKAKTDIIQLQVKVLVNEAEGLGFQSVQPNNPLGALLRTPPSRPSTSVHRLRLRQILCAVDRLFKYSYELTGDPLLTTSGPIRNSHYLHGTTPHEQDRLARLNDWSTISLFAR